MVILQPALGGAKGILQLRGDTTRLQVGIALEVKVESLVMTVEVGTEVTGAASYPYLEVPQGCPWS